MKTAAQIAHIPSALMLAPQKVTINLSDIIPSVMEGVHTCQSLLCKYTP